MDIEAELKKHDLVTKVVFIDEDRLYLKRWRVTFESQDNKSVEVLSITPSGSVLAMEMEYHRLNGKEHDAADRDAAMYVFEPFRLGTPEATTYFGAVFG